MLQAGRAFFFSTHVVQDSDAFFSSFGGREG